ncbi:hypothetical protein F4809DRAFT_473196 [Biscogniauxia mediterranea]|nr:hypothetical protein F4809DRAFT_473196 [Biscogniauxia mediterranea]
MSDRPRGYSTPGLGTTSMLAVILQFLDLGVAGWLPAALSSALKSLGLAELFPFLSPPVAKVSGLGTWHEVRSGLLNDLVPTGRGSMCVPVCVMLMHRSSEENDASFYISQKHLYVAYRAIRRQDVSRPRGGRNLYMEWLLVNQVHVTNSIPDMRGGQV